MSSMPSPNTPGQGLSNGSDLVPSDRNLGGASTASDVDTVVNSIEKLHEMYQRGLLNEEEFAMAKRKVLEPSDHAHSARGSHHSAAHTTATSSTKSSSSNGFFVPARTGLWRDVQNATVMPNTSMAGDGVGYTIVVKGEDDASQRTGESGECTGDEAGAMSSTDDERTRRRRRAHPHRHRSGSRSSSDARAERQALLNDTYSTTPANLRSPAQGAALPKGPGPRASQDTYGTFNVNAHTHTKDTKHPGKGRRGRDRVMSVALLSSKGVHVQYFNSRGAVGKTFEEIALYPPGYKVGYVSSSSSSTGSTELRRHKSRTRLSSKPPVPEYVGVAEEAAAAAVSQSRLSGDGAASPGAGLPPPAPAGRPSAESSGRPRKNSKTPSARRDLEELSSVSSNSTIVLNYDWHWIDVTGRDSSASAYKRVIGDLTEKFGLCTSLLVDREHHLVMPQFIEAASNEHQHLVVLRVATPKINLTDDSVLELSNRWLLLIDTQQKLVISLHRVDALPIAMLRARWAELMTNEVAFEEFLLKLLDDAVGTYSESLDVHDKVLDLCEARLLHTSTSIVNAKTMEEYERHRKTPEARAMMRHRNHLIANHFEEAETNPLLQALVHGMQEEIDRTAMNAFLYHMNRRSNVQHGILTATSPVLRKCFTEFRLCSEDRSQQMCSFCNDLAATAMNVRENAQHLLHMHIDLVSFQTNELMAVLTRFSIFFAPLSFLAGVYGVNFKYVPEFEIKYFYFYFWGINWTIVLVLWIYFRRRGLM